MLNLCQSLIKNVMANILAFFSEKLSKSITLLLLGAQSVISKFRCKLHKLFIVEGDKKPHTQFIWSCKLLLFVFRILWGKNVNYTQLERLLLRSYTYETIKWIKRDIIDICARRTKWFPAYIYLQRGFLTVLSKQQHRKLVKSKFRHWIFFVCVIFDIKQLLSNWLISEKYSYLLGTNSLVLKLCGY